MNYKNELERIRKDRKARADYGVKGMKWGERKQSPDAGGGGGAGSEPKKVPKTPKGAPKHWNSMFNTKVIDAYNSGKLTDNNIEEWETEYNGGRKPNPPLNTKQLLDFYKKSKQDPRKWGQ